MHVTLMAEGADVGDRGIAARHPVQVVTPNSTKAWLAIAPGESPNAAVGQDLIVVVEMVRKPQPVRPPSLATQLDGALIWAAQENPKSHDLFCREIPQTYHRASARSVRLSLEPRRGGSRQRSDREIGKGWQAVPADSVLVGTDAGVGRSGPAGVRG